MKSNILFYTSLVFSILLTIVSCSKMNDPQDIYLDGEIIYAAKIDSAAVNPGRNRAEIEMHLKSQRVESIRIFWNDYNDSTDVEVNNQVGVFKTTIDDLDEKGYVFNIVSFDNHGNKSLSYEITGEVYGDNFQSILTNRIVRSVNVSNNGDLVIKWGNPVNNSKSCILTYKDINNDETSKEVPSSDQETIIKDWKSDLKYNTTFIPDTTAIDIFYTDYKEIGSKYTPDYPLLKSEWNLLDYSSQASDGENAAKNAIDNDYNNRWHSASNDFPHWLYIDLGGEVNISRFAFWPSVYDLSNSDTHDSRFPSKVKLLVTNTEPSNHHDELQWTSLGEYELDNNKGGEHLITLEAPAKARYFKLVGTAPGSSNNYMVVGEIDIYVKTNNL